MNKVEGLVYLFTRQIKERPQHGDFTRDEYRELLARIRDWCDRELAGRRRE